MPVTGTCPHVALIRPVTPHTTEGCEDCLRIGSSWVHLRLCLSCGHVGCCDSSPMRHARRHAYAVGHPIVRSFEPGEDWRWCFFDEMLSRPVVLSDRALRQLARIREARSHHVRTHRREPSLSELAQATGLSPEHAESLVMAERTPRGLEEPIMGDEDGVGRLGDTLSDPGSDDDYELVVRRLQSEALRDLPDRLGERELIVVRARYGLDCNQRTLREIASGLGLSAEGVRQIEQRALAKLRDAICEDPGGQPPAHPPHGRLAV